MYREAASLANWLRENGVGKGDRVAAYVSQVPEAVVALLATASIGGAIWVGGVGAELAPRAVIDRFNMLQPKVLIAVDGYPYRGGRVFDKYGDVKQIIDSVKSIERVIIVPNMKDSVELTLSKPTTIGGKSPVVGGGWTLSSPQLSSTSHYGCSSRRGLRAYRSPWFTATVVYSSRPIRSVFTWIINQVISSLGTRHRHG